MTLEISDNEFEKEVMQSDIPVLVDFWGENCGPCIMISPIIKQLSEEMQGKVKIVKANIENNMNVASKFGIRSIPTLMIFKDGKLTSTKIGAHQKNKLEEWINSSI